MKKIVLVLAVFAAMGLVIGCGGSDNDCDKAAGVYMSGMDDYCGANADECLFCECWNQDQVVNDAGDGCEAPEDTGGEEFACEGDALTQAQACLADETACKQAAADGAKMICQASHMMDECDTDDDCVLDMTCGATGYCTM